MKKGAAPLEDKVSLLLSSEYNSNFHIEALKALAVVIRTNIARGVDESVEVNKNYNSGQSNHIEEVKRAVRETEGMVITYKGKLIDAKYHLACGGSTENSENVTGNPVLYLRRVLCKYCQNSPYWQNEKSLSIEEIQERIRKKFPHYTMEDIEIKGLMEEIKRDEYGRVEYLKIGNDIISGKELMELLDLDSTRFIIWPTGLKFISKGKGHGMGLCLYGANKMAEEGHSFEEIIKYYYTGVEIEKGSLPTGEKPLNGKIIALDPGHGGEDHGYKGDYLGLLEKDIVYNLSLKLKECLEELGCKVFLTRNGDEKVLASERIERVNNINPHFFISIHMDYYSNSNLKGVEMFHFRNDIESQKIGFLIEKNLKEMDIPTRGVKEGNFYLFRGIGASALMVEVGFLSNKDEEIKFKDQKYIDKIALCISKGISSYFI